MDKIKIAGAIREKVIFNIYTILDSINFIALAYETV